MSWFGGSNYVRRYFILDYEAANLLIVDNPRDEQSVRKGKKIVFRDILKVGLPADDQADQVLQRKVKSNTFKFPFFLTTINREYVLFAPSQKERQIWVDGFSYVIVSTKKVQTLI